MILNTLILTNFRSYSERKFEFSPGVNMIVGPNGVGKTNILEAIYTLLQGKSFRDSDEQLVKHDEQWWKVMGQMDDDVRELRYQLGQPSPKQILVDTVPKGRFTYRYQLPVVLFEPDDLLMIHGSPGARRSYLDNLLLKIDPTYRTVIAKYERALLQRNNLLKKGLSMTSLRDAMFVWDIAMAEYGAEIIRRRAELVGRVESKLHKIYSEIAGKKQSLSIIYQPSTEQSGHGLALLLNHSLEKDVVRGFTGIGPHRDDVEFVLSGKTAKQTASRGEVRTIVLALKRIEAEIIEELTHDAPVILMDDVFSELDHERQNRLIKDTKNQIIITTTSKSTSLENSINSSCMVHQL